MCGLAGRRILCLVRGLAGMLGHGQVRGRSRAWCAAWRECGDMLGGRKEPYLCAACQRWCLLFRFSS